MYEHEKIPSASMRTGRIESSATRENKTANFVSAMNHLGTVEQIVKHLISDVTGNHENEKTIDEVAPPNQISLAYLLTGGITDIHSTCERIETLLSELREIIL